MNILVTGGTSYIESHTCILLADLGIRLQLLTTFQTKEESVRRIRRITGRRIEFHKIDLLDSQAWKKLFANSSFDAVIHLPV